jgi:hypothetical protein
MTGGRALFWSEHIGGNQFRLRIRNNNPADSKQWFVFDSRTHTIRAWSDRNKAISNQKGQGFNKGKAAVVRPFENEVYQRMAFYQGSRQNLKNNNNKCIDVWGGANRNNQHITWWNCHNGLNQGWKIDLKGVSYPTQPLSDGVKF